MYIYIHICVVYIFVETKTFGLHTTINAEKHLRAMKGHISAEMNCDGSQHRLQICGCFAAQRFDSVFTAIITSTFVCMYISTYHHENFIRNNTI